MQQLGYGQRAHKERIGAPSVQDLSTAELKELSSSYKCRIARGTAKEADFQNYLRCQRELSQRL